MPVSPLTIQAWFQAPGQYGSSPQRVRGGEGGGGKRGEQGAGLRVVGSESVWVTRDSCVFVSALCLLYEVLERDIALSVEREDVISVHQ